LRLSTLAPRTGGLFSTGTSSDAAQPPFGLLEASEAPSRLSEFDLLLDVREPDEWADGGIGSPKKVALGRILRDINTEDLQSLKDKNLLVYCRSGNRSALACTALARQGFKVTNLVGGIRGWQQASSNKTN